MPDDLASLFRDSKVLQRRSGELLLTAVSYSSAAASYSSAASERNNNLAVMTWLGKVYRGLNTETEIAMVQFQEGF